MTFRFRTGTAFASLLLLSLGTACSADSSSSKGSGNTAAAGGDGDSGGITVGDGDGDGGLLPGEKPVAVLETTLPAGFAGNTEAPEAPQEWECGTLPGGQCFAPAGGYQVLGNVDSVQLDESNSCKNVLRGIVRDFTRTHPDFYGDADGADGLNLGLVLPTLGDDRKPVSAGSTAIATAIGDWFVNGGGGNVPYVVDFWLEPVGEMFVFDSSRFFPLAITDATNDQDQDNGGMARNFGFTTELHTAFEYKGGEVFTFTGDDDVFVFINNTLVVDLGGVHSQFSQSVNIDTLGLVVGDVYNLDLFHAERNKSGSNFRIETSLDFKECGVLESDIIVR